MQIWCIRNCSNNLLAGQLQPEKMITSKVRLRDVIDQGFEALLNHRDEHCKVIVDVQA